ncbi:hypothetical protein [Halioxenophilus aromaticivorans]|uniref:Uncharacterized protein n=1 Tax=Halioxenophilus aromaticivorans TaxID=1306992 RepID=A0AAV3TYN6_9ALTE
MKPLIQSKLARLAIILPVFVLASTAQAEDWTMSAEAYCETNLGNTVYSQGGLKASGGTAVVKCPLIKESATDAITDSYARMKRATSTGAQPFCYIVSKNNWGSINQYTYGYAANHTGNQSVRMQPSTQYHSGYADMYCVLFQNDVLFGVRYKQKN